MSPIQEHGIILELNAGEGVLSREVYANVAGLLILVDNEEKRLKIAEQS